jgi:hypothetical protein
MSDMTEQPAGLDLDENSDWLHTNDSYVLGTPQHEGTVSMPTGKQRVMLHLSDITLHANQTSLQCFLKIVLPMEIPLLF